jgi:hypothetical protein
MVNKDGYLGQGVRERCLTGWNTPASHDYLVDNEFLAPEPWIKAVLELGQFIHHVEETLGGGLAWVGLHSVLEHNCISFHENPLVVLLSLKELVHMVTGISEGMSLDVVSIEMVYCNPF